MIGLSGTDFRLVASVSSVSLLFRFRMPAVVVGSGRGVDPTSLRLRVTRFHCVS